MPGAIQRKRKRTIGIIVAPHRRTDTLLFKPVKIAFYPCKKIGRNISSFDNLDIRPHIKQQGFADQGIFKSHRDIPIVRIEYGHVIICHKPVARKSKPKRMDPVARRIIDKRRQLKEDVATSFADFLYAAIFIIMQTVKTDIT